MKILKQGATLQTWEIEIECLQNESGCGARYLLNADDIRRTEDWITRFFCKEYGYYCPNCGKLMQINNSLIPLHIQKAIDTRSKVKHKIHETQPTNSLALKQI